MTESDGESVRVRESEKAERERESERVKNSERVRSVDCKHLRVYLLKPLYLFLKDT